VATKTAYGHGGEWLAQLKCHLEDNWELPEMGSYGSTSRPNGSVCRRRLDSSRMRYARWNGEPRHRGASHGKSNDRLHGRWEGCIAGALS
jgi:hypothetical protein